MLGGGGRCIAHTAVSKVQSHTLIANSSNHEQTKMQKPLWVWKTKSLDFCLHFAVTNALVVVVLTVDSVLSPVSIAQW